MLFLTVDAILGNQAFQNGRYFICVSLGLDKIETGYNLAYGGSARNTRGSQNLGVLTKRYDNSFFSYQLTKVKTVR